MARKTVYIPDELDARVEQQGTLKDSYSQVVQEALREYLDARDVEDAADETPAES